MMHAIYKGKVFMVGDDLNECILIDRETGEEVERVDFGTPGLIVDPTDDQFERAESGLPFGEEE